MVEIKELPVMPTLLELTDLFEQHWEEVYGSTEHKVNIDFEMYRQMENAGMCYGLFAYFDGLIVGYSINVLAPNVHRKGNITSSNDALYVDPLFRDTSLGLRLIRETEKAAKSKGASMITWNAPMSTNLIKILPRLKYTPLEVVLCKEI